MANDGIRDGKYFLYMYPGVSQDAYAVEAPGNAKNGTYAKVESLTLAYGQIFEVSTMSNGKRRITSSSCGKALTYISGDLKVCLRDGNANTSTQAWEFEEIIGESVEINDEEYSPFNIVFAADNSYMMVKSGTDLKVAANADFDSGTAKFYFVPASIFHSGGVYELRPLSNTKLAVESFHTTVNDVNICLGSAMDDNTQKFIIKKVNSWTGLSTDPGYVIQNVSTGKYLTYINNPGDYDFPSPLIASKKDTTDPHMLWEIVKQTGSATIGDDAYAVYMIKGYSYPCAIDTEYATLSPFTDIVVMPITSKQRFVLLPSDGLDEWMTYPTEVGMAPEIGDAGKKVIDDVECNGRFYPTWVIPPSYAADGDYHVEYRYCYKKMDALTSTWSKWGSWTNWATPATVRDGRKCWHKFGLPISFGSGSSTSKLLCLNMEVRTAGNKEDTPLHGYAYSFTGYIHKRPTVAITSTTWTAEGLRVDYTSDYQYGTTITKFYSLSNLTTTKEYMAINSGYRSETSSTTGTLYIPLDKFKEWPAEGASLILRYRVGNDQREPWFNDSSTVSISYTGGTTSVSPTFVEIGPRLIAEVPHLGKTRVWVSYDGNIYECDVAENYTPASGKRAFEIIYPMGKDFKVFVSSTNSDGSQWGTTMVSHDAMPYVFHAFNWKGGSVYLQRFIGDRAVATTYEAVCETDVLDSRARESVSYASTVKVRKSVSGILLSDDVSDISDLTELANKHVVYRSPLGSMHEVAIVSVRTTERGNRIEVSVDMVEEAVASQ